MGIYPYRTDKVEDKPLEVHPLFIIFEEETLECGKAAHINLSSPHLTVPVHNTQASQYVQRNEMIQD